MKRSFACIVLFLLDCAFSVESSRSISRFLNEVLTTADCPKKRLSYPLRIEATFLYTARQNETNLDLKTMEHAIATSVSSLLTACDADGRALQVVEISDERRHEVISLEYVGDFCAQRESCILIRGMTSILSSGDTTTTAVQSDTKVIIERAFDDWDYLTQLANVDDVSLALFLGVNIVPPSFDDEILDKHSRTSQSRSLRIGAIVTIVLVTVSGLVFYMLSQKSDPGDGGRKNRMLFLQAKRRRFFQDLDNQNSLPMGWMVLNASYPTTLPKDGNDPTSLPKDGTVTWSVSDLTSDAESIKSNFPLERIVEVEDERSSDEGTVKDRSYAASSPTYVPRSPVKIADLEFIADWNEHSIDFSPTGAQGIVRDVNNMMYNGQATLFWTEEESGQEVSILSSDDMELDGYAFADESGAKNMAMQISNSVDMATSTASHNHNAGWTTEQQPDVASTVAETLTSIPTDSTVSSSI